MNVVLSLARERKKHRDDEPMVLNGYLLLFAAATFFVLCSYAAVFSKLMPETGVAVLDGIRNDRYYCLLIPLLIPVTVIVVYMNWLGLKIFRHN
jgi:hypothetical protein